MKQPLVPEFVKIEPASVGEKWVQQAIENDPSILGLGNLVIVGRERIQPAGGRIDFLLASDEDESDRYVVEIQLGRTDESHIIRTIEVLGQ